MSDPENGGGAAPAPPATPEPGVGRLLRLTATARTTVLIAILFYPVGIAFHLNVLQPSDSAVPIDFSAFWAAAKLAVQGDAVSAFDLPTLQAAEPMPPHAEGAYFAWFYPPTFHLLVAPLGWFGFSPAFAIFTAVGVGAYCLALRPWVRGNPLALNLAIAAPAVLTVVFTGNTSLLWIAAFLAAMHGLTCNRPAQAGLFIALLTFKPQLGLLIPVALIAGRHWATIFWASLFTTVLVLLATAVFGLDYWAALYRNTVLAGEMAALNLEFSRTMLTWYAFARRFGAEHEAAMLIQIAPSILALAAVAAVWARRGADADLKVAVLLLAALTATPRAFQYEAMLSLVAAVFLLRAGIGATRAGRVWLFALWLLPAPGRLIPGLDIDLAKYAAPLIGASLVLCTAIALRRKPRIRPGPSQLLDFAWRP